MIQNEKLWSDLIKIVKNLKDRKNGPPVSGRLAISDQQILNAVQACRNAVDDTKISINDDDDVVLALGQQVSISLSPRYGLGRIATCLDALLRVPSARIKEPRNYFLLNEQVGSGDFVSEDHVLYKYRVVIKLIEMLREVAAFLDQEAPSLVFVKDGKFEIPILYTEQDISAMDLIKVQSLLVAIPDGVHHEHCKAILSEVLVELTSHISADQRFSFLIKNAEEIKKRFDEGYKLFASGFSYEKVKDQVESARVEYVGKIHKVLSDIQNQLLGIPVATIIVATQMKVTSNVDGAFWTNVAVLLGCWVFAVLMLFLLYNQLHTLDVLRDEILRQKKHLQKEYAAVASNFLPVFDYLLGRVRSQRIVVFVIDAFVVVGVLLSHVIFFKLTAPACYLISAILCFK